MIAVAICTHLATVIDDLTYLADEAGGNVFLDHMPDQPNEAVMVKGTGGLPQLTRWPWDQPTVQVLVRGAPYDHVGAYVRARAIYAELACLDAVTLDDGGDHEIYVEGCTATQSDVTPLGRDDQQRPEYSLNFQLHTQAPTSHRP